MTGACLFRPRDSTLSGLMRVVGTRSQGSSFLATRGLDDFNPFGIGHADPPRRPPRPQTGHVLEPNTLADTGALFTGIHHSVSANPNGIPSSSPGLVRGTSTYPGCASEEQA